MAPVGTLRNIAWQGGEHDFCLSQVQSIFTLEESCGAGIAAIHHRLLTDQWRLADIREVIRLGLIGSGQKPDVAARLVKLNVEENPNGLAPSVVLAVRIIEAVLFGVPQDDLEGKESAPGAAKDQVFSQTMVASGAEQSTSSVQP